MRLPSSISETYVEGLSDYMTAVRNNPIRPKEGAISYAARIAQIVSGVSLPPPAKSMREPGCEG